MDAALVADTYRTTPFGVTERAARALLNGGRAASPRTAYGIAVPTPPTSEPRRSAWSPRVSSPSSPFGVAPARSVAQHCAGTPYASCGDDDRHGPHTWFDFTI